MKEKNIHDSIKFLTNKILPGLVAGAMILTVLGSGLVFFMLLLSPLVFADTYLLAFLTGA